MSDRTNGEPARPAAHDEPPDHPHERSHGRRTRAEERIAALDASPALAAQVAELTAQLESAQREAADAKAGWQRAAADMANYRRRTEQERLDTLGLASESLLLKVLALADDFDRAVAHIPDEQSSSPWVEGVVAIDRKLRQLLESEGVTPIEAVGHPFDPREHDAVLHEPTDQAADGIVLRELARGYRLRDRVLRPALVAVASNESSTDAPPRRGAHDT